MAKKPNISLLTIEVKKSIQERQKSFFLITPPFKVCIQSSPSIIESKLGIIQVY